MIEVTIYSTPVCPYCVRAKNLLKARNQAYKEVDVSDDEERAKMIELAAGKRTVPQIFIGDTHVGGYDDLAALDRKGELDALLQA
jgi:glutaredoxin 3